MTFTRILVDIDAGAPTHPALAQAAQLAACCGAHLTLVDTMPEVPKRARSFLTPRLEEELIAHRRELLASLASGITSVTTSTQVLRGRPATAIIHEVLQGGHDLVVRAHARDLASPPPPFGAVDMELLRQCPCPVWLIGPSGPPPPQRIVAAVHSDTADHIERQLNRLILELALMLTSLEHAELTVIEAWSVLGEDLVRRHLRPADLAGFVENTRQVVESSLQALVESFGGRLDSASIQLVKGYPEDVIPTYVHRHGIDVVVMGTVARTGVAGLIMGNTAERVLRRLQGCVLAVKPPGFVSPVVQKRA